MRDFFKKFAHEESGSASIELLLCVPIIFWVLLSTIVYFDAFENEAISTRASLTIADMISREDATIDNAYINNAARLLTDLTETERTPELRVTVFRYRNSDNNYQVRWSRTSNVGGVQGYGGQRVTTSMLRSREFKNRLPIMSDQERAILIETRTQYEPLLSAISISPILAVGNLDDVEFNTFTVISPRFTNSVCMERSGGRSPRC
ncbi:hypothetical protein [Yoonia sp. 2307UL14-13]|uniref:hypothetical protein n=1 Tax=Yoonia sp. 2307UL14-13 TaxID=3126506 RepID=UPI0030B5BF48